MVHASCGWEGAFECHRPLSDKRDPVTGKLNDLVRRDCDGERRHNRTLFGRERCGPSGKFFEAK
jgi:hypothetical protein